MPTHSPVQLLRSRPARAGSAMSSERGAALLAALCFATVLAIALASYMTVCYRTLAMSTQSGMSTRSVELAWV